MIWSGLILAISSIAPGSLYGSVLSNFLPEGINQALKESPAVKILITNLVSDRNQTHRLRLADYIGLFKRYTGLDKPVDIAVIPRLSLSDFNRLHPDVAANYRLEHSHFLSYSPPDIEKVKRQGVRIIAADTFAITPTLNRIRHDPAKLAKILKPLLA